jgi:hypothetical protein
MDTSDSGRLQRNRRWVRKPGSPLYESLDSLAKIIMTLCLLGGIAMTVVHVCLSPNGISVEALVPMLVVLGCIAVIVAPVSAIVVNVTVRKMKLAPRDDTYVRLVLCMTLPFSLALMTGWPEYPRLHWIAGLGWPLAILLLLYFFRAEVVEWIASLLATAIAASLSLILVALVANVVNDLANGLYADMLPEGPWIALARGHSPMPGTRGAPTLTLPFFAAGANGGATVPFGGTSVNTPKSTQPTGTPIASSPSPTTATGPASLRVASPFFTAVIDSPALADSFAFVTAPGSPDWMLVLKNTGTSIEADRWTVNPLEKKDRYSSPNFPKSSPQFTLSPKGDGVAILSFLPRRHLEIFVPDKPALNRSIWLDVANNIPEGVSSASVPTLLGSNDPTRYFVRWDTKGASTLQFFTVAASPTGAFSQRSVAIGPVVENCPPVFSPDGRLTAIMGPDLLYFAKTDGSTPPQPFPVAADPNIRVLAMAFSPDSSQIAVLAAIDELPTLACYQVRNGDSVFTSLLSQTSVDKDAPVFPHTLLWLPGCQSCLVNGTDLIDTATGKKYATLDLPPLLDAQVLGTSTLALTFRTLDGPRTFLANLDDAKLRAAKSK